MLYYTHVINVQSIICALGKTKKCSQQLTWLVSVKATLSGM